jgi:hypothetical protein
MTVESPAVFFCPRTQMIDQYIQQLQAEKASSLKQCWQVFDVSHWGDYAANHHAEAG